MREREIVCVCAKDVETKRNWILLLPTISLDLGVILLSLSFFLSLSLSRSNNLIRVTTHTISLV